jgi:hypothetical protein
MEKRGSQRELVQRLPVEKMLNAAANSGYLLAAALLRERAILSILTLNFDLAMSHALSQVGATTDVAVIEGVAQVGRLSAFNLIYLHSSANMDPELWVLRRDQLETEWRGTWRQVLAQRLLTAPVIVFAGLGSPASLVTESVTKIRAELGRNGVTVYQVDPGQFGSSAFSAAINIPAPDYIRLPWGIFMHELSERLAEEHRARLEGACNRLIGSEHLPNEDTARITGRVSSGGLLKQGARRALWLREGTNYLPGVQRGWEDHIADLVLAVAMIERMTGSSATFADDGTVEFASGNRQLGRIILASGQGVRRWASMEARLRTAGNASSYYEDPPIKALVAGVVGGRQTMTPPPDITFGSQQEELTGVQGSLEMIDVDELRRDASLLRKFLALTDEVL